MTATHATRVTNLRPRVDRKAEVAQAADEVWAAIVIIHALEHSGVTMGGCANPICRSYVAYLRATA